MTHQCTNPNCDYGPLIEHDDGHVVQLPADAYSQDEQSWAEGKPRFGGLCLNCISDADHEEMFFDYDW